METSRTASASRTAQGWAVALGVFLAPAAYGQAPSSCDLVTPAEVTQVARAVRGPFTEDSVGEVTPAQVKGLPVALKLRQCSSVANADGVIGWRIGTLTAPRALSAAEWKAVEAAVDDKGDAHPQDVERRIGDHRCWQMTRPLEGLRRGKQQTDVGCAAERGRHHLTVEFGDTDKSRLPTLQQVSELLAKAAARLR